MNNFKFEKEIISYVDRNEFLVTFTVANYFKIGSLEERSEAKKQLDNIYSKTLVFLEKYKKRGIIFATNGFDCPGELDLYIHLKREVSSQQLAGVKRAIENFLKKF